MKYLCTRMFETVPWDDMLRPIRWKPVTTAERCPVNFNPPPPSRIRRLRPTTASTFNTTSTTDVISDMVNDTVNLYTVGEGAQI